MHPVNPIFFRIRPRRSFVLKRYGCTSSQAQAAQGREYVPPHDHPVNRLDERLPDRWKPIRKPLDYWDTLSQDTDG